MLAHRNAHPSVALARIAVDLDQLVEEITAEPLADGDDDLLQPAITHLALSMAKLDDATYQLELLDRRCERLLAALHT